MVALISSVVNDQVLTRPSVVVRAKKAGTHQGSQLESAGDSELAEDVGHVRLEGLDLDLETMGRLPVGVTTGDEVDDFAFSGGETFDAGSRLDLVVDVEEVTSDFLGHRLAPGEGIVEEVGEVFVVRRLREVTVDAGVHHREDVEARRRHGERHDARFRHRLPNLANGSCPSSSGKPNVEEENVGLALFGQLDGRIDVVGFSDDVEAFVEEGTRAESDDVMVVDEQEPGTRAHGITIVSVISAPSPPSLVISAVPPNPVSLVR